jgi:rhombotail lipoprotein
MTPHVRTFRAGAVLRLACGVLAASWLAGCAMHEERHRASSVVEYLYPNVKDPVVAPSIPTLKLPLRVGIAFVPDSSFAGTALTEQRKAALMKRVAEHFETAPYVKGIEVIPSAYLQRKGGFANLDQLRTMYGVDLVALVSYDQVQFTDQGLLGLTYWTIVGAYVVPGERNDTQTMLDTVVLDVPSRKLLFRAPGTDRVHGRSTPVNLGEQLRQDSEASFDAAATRMIANLDAQLAEFKDRVRDRPDEYRVVRTQEYEQRVGGGGGAAQPWLLPFALLALLRRRARPVTVR